MQLSGIKLGYDNEEILIAVFKENREFMLSDKPRSQIDKCVFSNKKYIIELEDTEEIVNIANIYVYINDESVESRWHPEKKVIDFDFEKSNFGYIFADCYGYVEIRLMFEYSEGETEIYQTGYLAVAIPREEASNTVQKMAEFVYCNQDRLLMGSDRKLRISSGMKEGGYQNIETYIAHTEDVVKLYESSYHFFKSNCRVRLDTQDVVGDVEKMQFLSNRTIRFIACNPQYLKPTLGNDGIRYSGRTYMPNKTLVQQSVISMEIYENKEIVAFLAMVRERTYTLLLDMNGIIGERSQVVIPEGYVFSLSILQEKNVEYLQKQHQKLEILYGKLQELTVLYRGIFSFAENIMTVPPKATAIFMQVPQYSKMYKKIYEWFFYGQYDLQSEKYIFSFIKISALYEVYIITKWIDFLSKRQYILKDSVYYDTAGTIHGQCDSKYIFEGEDGAELVIYYQPRITNATNADGIKLYRNNSLSYNRSDSVLRSGNYYCPDFLIQYKRENKTRYMIADAKYSRLTNIKARYFNELIYKYIFSISPTESDVLMMGLSILYGKITGQEVMTSAYDYQIVGSPVKPFVQFVPMMETINDERQEEEFFDLIRLITR